MLTVTVTLSNEDTEDERLMGSITIANITEGLEDADGFADYEWALFAGGLTHTGVPVHTGRVETHRRVDGWFVLVSRVLADAALHMRAP